MQPPPDAPILCTGGPQVRPVLAVVEIADNPALLIVAGVFILTFLAVCVLAVVVLTRRRSDGKASTWNLQSQGELPVSKKTFDRISTATARAISPPGVTPEARARLNDLEKARGTFRSIYRGGMIGVGLVGLVGALLLFRSHTPANMHGLPAAIVLLLSLGALLNGLSPSSPVLRRVKPLDPSLLEQMRQKIKVDVRTEPLSVTLTEADLRRAAEMRASGRPLDEIARAVYRAYDQLSEFDKRAFEATLRRLLEQTGKT
jgi:hypothetical protein